MKVQQMLCCQIYAQKPLYQAPEIHQIPAEVIGDHAEQGQSTKGIQGAAAEADRVCVHSTSILAEEVSPLKIPQFDRFFKIYRSCKTAILPKARPTSS